MSITFQKYPEKIAPVYNENYIRLIDSNAGQSDYKYIVKLYQKQTTAAQYSLVGVFTYMPMADGALEFEPMSILSNYVNNGSYAHNSVGVAYRTSFFQYKVEICRTYAGQTEQVITAFDPYYAFDGAMSQAEMNQLQLLVSGVNPAIVSEAHLATGVYQSSGNTETFIFQNVTVDHKLGNGYPGSFVNLFGFSTPSNNGFKPILSKVQPDPVNDPFTWHVKIGDYSQTGSRGAFLFYGYEPETSKSISNCPTALNLSPFDYYTADFFKYIPEVTSSEVPAWRTIALTLHCENEERWYNLTPYPTANQYLETDIMTVPIGPMNIKAANWYGMGGTYSGESLFNDWVFHSYTIDIKTYYTKVGLTDYPPLIHPITVNVCRSKTPVNKKMFDRTWLVYKSKMGGWSYLSFNMKAKKTQDTARVTYNRRLRYDETYQSRGTTVISNSVSQTYSLTSDWVSNLEWKYYEELFSSPQVYMLRNYVNGEANTIDPFLPCVIKTTSSPIYKPNDDKLFHYSIDVETAVQTIRQRT